MIQSASAAPARPTTPVDKKIYTGWEEHEGFRQFRAVSIDDPDWREEHYREYMENRSRPFLERWKNVEFTPSPSPPQRRLQPEVLRHADGQVRGVYYGPAVAAGFDAQDIRAGAYNPQHPETLRTHLGEANYNRLVALNGGRPPVIEAEPPAERTEAQILGDTFWKVVRPWTWFGGGQ